MGYRVPPPPRPKPNTPPPSQTAKRRVASCDRCGAPSNRSDTCDYCGSIYPAE